MVLFGLIFTQCESKTNKQKTDVFRLTSPTESKVVSYYRHAEVCSLTGTVRACARKQGRVGYKQLVLCNDRNFQMNHMWFSVRDTHRDSENVMKETDWDCEL